MTNMRPPNKTILLKVVILGDGGVGKSCLMNRFVSNRYDENNFHTIGVEFMNKNIDVDGEKYTLQFIICEFIMDTYSAQQRFRIIDHCEKLGYNYIFGNLLWIHTTKLQNYRPFLKFGLVLNELTWMEVFAGYSYIFESLLWIHTVYNKASKLSTIPESWIWDTAGQERFRALRTPFYRGSDVCMLCYSVDDRESFRGLKQWRREFLFYADVKPEKFPFIVVGNKLDMAPKYRQVNSEEVEQWCKDNGITSLIETSSKAASNVTDAFVLAVRQWKHMERIAENELRQNSDTIDLTRSIRLAQNRFCCIGGGGGSSAGSTTSADAEEEDASMRSNNSGTRPSPFRFVKRSTGESRPAMNFQL